MKQKLLLLFLLVCIGVLGKAQSTEAYKHLIITEAEYHDTYMAYFEITNMGDQTINLKEFQWQHVPAWVTVLQADESLNFTGYGPSDAIMLPDKELAPGESFVISSAYDYNPVMWKKDPEHWRERVTKPEFYKLAGLLVHIAESTPLAAGDSVSSNPDCVATWDGRECFAIRHFFTNPETGLKDSLVVDQIGGVFDDNGQNNKGSYDVAGVTSATSNSILVRKSSVTTGNLNFKDARGIDLTDSEWIPIPIPSYNNYNKIPWRAVFWTVGNQVNATLDETTLISKTGKVKVDFANSKITVPWGVRNDDSLMYQFVKKPGLAWKYDYSPNPEDSAYISARTGDKLTVYACGDQATMKTFDIEVLPPTIYDNIVIPKNAFAFSNKNGLFPVNGDGLGEYSGIRVTNGLDLDTISNIDFATRVDTLYKYLEKAPNASWDIIFADGVKKPDLKTGDLLHVKSESGRVKDYYLKLEKFAPNSNAFLSSITWPDIPEWFKGDIAGVYGWKGDTIPGFTPTSGTYLVKIPAGYDGIPALAYTKQALDSRVVVDRAKTLDGTVADRTVTFTVFAENDTTKAVYTVQFEKEKDPANVQPYIAEPFISQYVFRSTWSTSFIELYNPGTEPIDLSHYMLRAAYGTEGDTWDSYNATDAWANAYMKYIPGKKWQDEANWQVQPRIVEPDLSTPAILYPGETYVMGYIPDGWYSHTEFPFANIANINLAFTPWGLNLAEGNECVGVWPNNQKYFYKILNDSVVNGLKPATDRNDFELIESMGGLNTNTFNIAGMDFGAQRRTATRKPDIYKGNPEPNASFGTNADDSEWIISRPEDYAGLPFPDWRGQDVAICTGLGSHNMKEVTFYKSTVTSTKYKVSPGYSDNETIKGLKTPVTVGEFYNNIIKADPLQTLKVKSVSTGLELAEADALNNGDELTVLSADSTNTSKYILSVTAEGLSSNAVLTSANYTIEVNGTTGTVSGFDGKTLLKDVYDGVVIPVGATMTMIDENDAYMTFNKLNYDSTYVNVIATNKVFFEVIAENGITKITYQLSPTTNPSEAYVTSDIYSVDQEAALIQFVPAGTSATSLLHNVTPNPGASIKIYDKGGFERATGDVYRDDKLVVTSEDGKVTKTYYFSMLNFNVNTYLAYVISDVYIVDQIHFSITGGIETSTAKADFVNKLIPAFGATLSVLDKDGNVSTAAELKKGDQLLVTAADGSTTATYAIDVWTTKIGNQATSSIKMYPNPTTERVVINGLTKGNRVRVLNTAGVVLRDVIVDNATEYVSLSTHPAGIYMFIVSDGKKNLNIQKVIKK